MVKEYGIQPLHDILEQNFLKNDDLVQASDEQLTHKQVQKSRKGRYVTANIKSKVMRALNQALDGQTYSIQDIFNYS